MEAAFRLTTIARALFSALIAGALWSSPVSAQCLDKQMLEAFLKHEEGLTLHSWGLTDDGDMLELWIGDRGHWATVRTTPQKCSTVELPFKLKGRLWTPPSPNKAIPPDRIMNEGQEI